MKRKLLAAGIVVGLAVTGCSQRTSPVESTGHQPLPQGLEIVRLVGQHQTIIVTSGPEGPLYSAQTTDGRSIVANATLEELREMHPEIYRFIEPGVAVDASDARR